MQKRDSSRTIHWLVLKTQLVQKYANKQSTTQVSLHTGKAACCSAPKTKMHNWTEQRKGCRPIMRIDGVMDKVGHDEGQDISAQVGTWTRGVTEGYQVLILKCKKVETAGCKTWRERVDSFNSANALAVVSRKEVDLLLDCCGALLCLRTVLTFTDTDWMCAVCSWLNVWHWQSCVVWMSHQEC